MSKGLNIAEIIINQRLPRQQSIFDYDIGGLELAAGDLVEVDFRRQKIRGLVYKLKNSSQVPLNRLKKINKLIMKSYLYGWQVNLLSWLSINNCVSLGQAFLLFSTVQPNRVFKPEFEFKKPIKSGKKTEIINLVYNDPLSHQKYVKVLLGKVLDRQQQVLLLVPELQDLQKWQSYLSQYFKVDVFHSGLSTKEAQAVWLKCRQETNLCVIATRAGLFLPWNNLGGLVIDSSDNDNFKQYDQNPRYNSNDVAEKMSDMLNISLAKVSSFPRLKDWSLSHIKKQIWREVGNYLSETKLINTSDKFVKNESFILADEVIDSIQANLGKGQIFVYVNRLGEATNLTCQDCHYHPTCSICDRNLVWSDKVKSLSCFHCNKNYPIPDICPVCRSVNLKTFGVGLEKVFKEMSRLWPNVKISQVTSEIKAPAVPSLLKSDIVVGTKYVWPYLDKINLSVVVMVDLGAELSLPEFSATEKVLAFIKNCQSDTKANIYIQSKKSDLEVLNYALRPRSNFYEHEMSLRDKFGYPPATKLVKLIIQNIDNKAAEKIAKEARELINSAGLACDIIGPYPDYYKQVRGRYRFYILLKCKQDNDPNLNIIINKLDSSILVDNEPIYVLT